MPSPARGQIWLADFGSPTGREQAGRRPALVVSTDRHNRGPAPVVFVVPITSHRGIPTHVPIDAREGGLDRHSVAMCDNLRALDKRRLLGPLGNVSPVALAAVSRRLRLLLEL